LPMQRYGFFLFLTIFKKKFGYILVKTEKKEFRQKK